MRPLALALLPGPSNVPESLAAETEVCLGPAKPREGPVCNLSRPGAPGRRPVALSCSPQGQAIWSGRQTLARGKGLWPWVPRPRQEGFAWLLLGSGPAATAEGPWARWPPTRQAEKWDLAGFSLRRKTRAHHGTFQVTQTGPTASRSCAPTAVLRGIPVTRTWPIPGGPLCGTPDVRILLPV